MVRNDSDDHDGAVVCVYDVTVIRSGGRAERVHCAVDDSRAEARGQVIILFFSVCTSVCVYLCIRTTTVNTRVLSLSRLSA